ncbi:MAG: hypothetical protein AB7J28_12345 [Hyphomonadaceae bacterium]
MAGAVLISTDDALSLAGPAFRYVAEKVRGLLLEEQQYHVVRLAFEPYDTGGLDALVLIGLDGPSFCAVYRATLQASRDLPANEKHYVRVWEMLIEKLRRDPRIQQ